MIRKILLFEGLENMCRTACLVLGKMCVRHSFKVKKCDSSEKADLFPYSCISSYFNSYFKFLCLLLLDFYGNVNHENYSFLYRFAVGIMRCDLERLSEGRTCHSPPLRTWWWSPERINEKKSRSFHLLLVEARWPDVSATLCGGQLI